MSTNTSLNTSVTEEKKSRLIITNIIVENFKSYAGIREIGPFHESFTCIVGPNGSGNTYSRFFNFLKENQTSLTPFNSYLEKEETKFVSKNFLN
jgi:predicted ATP-binding protein involved in virulence